MKISWKTWGQFVLQCAASAVMLAAILFMNNYATVHNWYSGASTIPTLVGIMAAGIGVFMIVGKIFGIFSFMKEFNSVAKE